MCSLAKKDCSCSYFHLWQDYTDTTEENVTCERSYLDKPFMMYSYSCSLFLNSKSVEEAEQASFPRQKHDLRAWKMKTIRGLCVMSKKVNFTAHSVYITVKAFQVEMQTEVITKDVIKKCDIC